MLPKAGVVVIVTRRQSQKAAVATESLPLFEAEAKEREKIRKSKDSNKEIIPDSVKGQARDKAAAAVLHFAPRFPITVSAKCSSLTARVSNSPRPGQPRLP